MLQMHFLVYAIAELWSVTLCKCEQCVGAIL